MLIILFKIAISRESSIAGKLSKNAFITFCDFVQYLKQQVNRGRIFAEYLKSDCRLGSKVVPGFLCIFLRE